MMNDRMKLREFFEDGSYNFFLYLEDSLAVPWRNALILSSIWGDYIYNRSGEKFISNYLKKLSESLEDGEIPDTVLYTLLDTFRQYLPRWAKLYNVFELDYNPIQNYDMTETTTNTKSETGSTSGNTSGTENETRTPNTTTTATDEIQGFNSSSYQPSEKNTTTETGTETTSKTNSGTTSRTSTVNGTENGTLRRSGNIGVTTTQQMIQSEIQLWQWDFIHEVLYKDFDSVFCLKCY